MCTFRALSVLALFALQVPALRDPQALGVPAGPGPVESDLFHPELGEDAPAPRSGGRVVVHLASRPRSFNYMLENSAVARQLLNELHEPLIRRDWESWEWSGVLAQRFEVDETGCEWTFHLRDDVLWHDGHPFDARDVWFTWTLWKNPEVDCDRRRYMFDKITAAEMLDEHTVRFVFERPYFMAASAFDESFTVLPSHRYDLSDPDNPDGDPEASPSEQARWVNAHPCNTEWIGLGPYRLEEATSQYLEARRFEGYFDPAQGGWLDAIRWRIIPDAVTARQALLAGELDFLDRLSSEDYFGAPTASPAFASRFYKGYYFTPYMGYTAWNLHRPVLADARVRTALAHCFDWEAFIAGHYQGLAFRVTGEQWYSSPTYDRTLEPLPFDLSRARVLLAEAGWYDRDGDGQVDRDGVPLELELLSLAGNAVSAAFGQLFQENLREVGVDLRLTQLAFPALQERVVEREFDALNLGLVLALESDPEQLWHSRWSEGTSSNRSGLADEEVDLLIEAIQTELDVGERRTLFHRLQRRLYALQPFQFGLCAPHRFAMARRVRGVEFFALDPGYSLRRWFVVQ